ncbi:GntR family transcriptional regulator [Rhizomonospora bruguierae]|uniref:GntR family transcriptional regulator n=1 Tax=Rhizomonospora bruguierae TaxID=1581705 RepID=UPI001BD0D0CC|nr:GntR family transcriptional regulator [Micromonospora sp. NBRC 107566]
MNTLAPIEAANLSELSVGALRRAIVSGSLAPGEVLRDRQLAESLGVSRTPVREALHRLQSEGLVEARGRSGWAVSAFTEQDVREMFGVRMLLEPAGLDQLARSGSQAQLEAIAGQFIGFHHPVPPERMEEYFDRDDRFHKTIVAATGNSRIIGFYAILSIHINRGRYILSGSRSDRLEDTLDEHKAITSALLRHDFPKARAALVDHLRTGEELMLRQVRLRNG